MHDLGYISYFGGTADAACYESYRGMYTKVRQLSN